jgi:hypothetical protein
MTNFPSKFLIFSGLVFKSLLDLIILSVTLMKSLQFLKPYRDNCLEISKGIVLTFGLVGGIGKVALKATKFPGKYPFRKNFTYLNISILLLSLDSLESMYL